MTVKEIGNGIFEALRLATVNAGYFPDITDYLDPKDPQGYLEAKQSIIAGGKELIEVFNVGGYIARPHRKVNDVTIDFLQADVSKRGTIPMEEYTLIEGGNPDLKRYAKSMTAKSLYDVIFQIQYIAYSEEYAAIIERIINKTLSAHATLYGHRDDGTKMDEHFVIIRTQAFDTSGTDFIERGWRFIVPGMDLDGLTDTGRIVPQNIEITIEVDPIGTDDEVIRVIVIEGVAHVVIAPDRTFPIYAEHIIYEDSSVKAKLDELTDQIRNAGEITLSMGMVDYESSGVKINMIASQALRFGDACYVAADGRMCIADASANTTATALFICAEQSIEPDQSGSFLFVGVLRCYSWNWDVSKPVKMIYLSASGQTGATLTQDVPEGSGITVQVLGTPITPTDILFNPNFMKIVLK